MTNHHCQAVGCYGEVEAHKRYNRVNNSFWIKSYPTNRASEKIRKVGPMGSWNTL